MLFAPVPSTEDRYNADVYKNTINGSFPILHVDLYAQTARNDYERIVDALDMISLNALAKALGIKPDAYRALAEQNKALLFDLHDGKAMVPLWGLNSAIVKDVDHGQTVVLSDLENAINPVSVALAKLYKEYKPTLGAGGFCRFVDKTLVTLSAQNLPNAIQKAFAHAGLNAGDQKIMGLSMPLKDALGSTCCPIKAVASEMLRQAKLTLLDEKPVWPNTAQKLKGLSAS